MGVKQPLATDRKSTLMQFVPVMLCFFAMGFAADAVGQAGAVAVMTAGVAYLLYYTLKIKKVTK